MKVSIEVSSALVNQSGGQLATLAAIVLDPCLMDKGYPAALQRAATDARLAPKSDKTWANYTSTARAVLVRVADLFPDREPAAFELADRLASELKRGGYFTQADDVARWAKGKPAIVAATKAKAKTVPVAAPVAAPVADAAPVAAPVPVDLTDLVPVSVLVQFMSDGTLTIANETTARDLADLIMVLQSEVITRTLATA